MADASVKLQGLPHPNQDELAAGYAASAGHRHPVTRSATRGVAVESMSPKTHWLDHEAIHGREDFHAAHTRRARVRRGIDHGRDHRSVADTRRPRLGDREDPQRVTGALPALSARPDAHGLDR